jgi:hypothetical protein
MYQTLKKLIMSNLLTIEQEFLSSAQVSNDINFDRIFSLTDDYNNAKKKKFETSLKLAKLVYEAFLWYDKPETKQLLTDNDIEWTTKEIFINRVFGWQKSFGYKMNKAGKLCVEESSVVTKFKRACTSAENNGQDAIRSVEALLKFASSQGTEATEGGEGTGEGEVQTRKKTYATFSIAKDGVNGESGFSIRLSDAAEMNGMTEITINGAMISEMEDAESRLMAVFNHMKSILDQRYHYGTEH